MPVLLNKGYAQQSQQRYNVILISLDDMNEKTEYLGYPAVLTPNLQRLIKKGQLLLQHIASLHFVTRQGYP